MSRAVSARVAVPPRGAGPGRKDEAPGGRPACVLASDGKAVAADCSLEGVIELKSESAIGYRLARRATKAATGTELTDSEIEALAGVDILKIELACIQEGLTRIRRLASPPPTLVLPVAFSSVCSHRGRGEVTGLLRQARASARFGVITEISGVEGAPHAILQEAVSCLAPLSLATIARLKPSRPMGLASLRGLGFRGFAFGAPPEQTPGEFLGWSQARISAAREAASLVFLYGASHLSFGHGLSLGGFGASHATLRARSPASPG